MINYKHTDISDALAGYPYSGGQNYLIASYGAGWTLTGIDVQGMITVQAENSPTNTASWVNAGQFQPIMQALVAVPNGTTPLFAHTGNFPNSQWLQIESVDVTGMSFEVLNGSTAIGSTFHIPVDIRYRVQVRLAAATDYYFQTFVNSASAPHWTFTGIGTVWTS
jgi:hypothetical protein